MSNDQISFNPIGYLERSLRYWWLVVLFSIAGGMAGYLLHLSQPPEYEARAMITVGIDFARTGYLTDIEEDQIIGLVGDVISSTSVMQQLEDEARKNGLTQDGEIARQYMKLERWGFRYAARAKHPDPQTAAKLSNLWAEIAMNVIEESSKHAVIAEGLDRYILSLESCLQTLVTLNPVHGQCSNQSIADLQRQIKSTVDKLEAEKSLSQGISPSVQLVLTEDAAIPFTPVRFGKNIMVFSGTMLGFMIGIILVELDIPGKFHRGK